MANYNDLKTAIQQVIRTNGNEEITGALLQQSLLSMINSLGIGYQFRGVATPSTNPGTPDQKVFYIAVTPGEYANFGGNIVNFMAIFRYDTSWQKLELETPFERILNSAKYIGYNTDNSGNTIRYMHFNSSVILDDLGVYVMRVKHINEATSVSLQLGNSLIPAKTMYYKGAPASKTNTWNAESTLILWYDSASDVIQTWPLNWETDILHSITTIDYTDGYYIGSDGRLYANAAYRTSGFIPVNAGDSLINNCGHNICFFDKQKKIITGSVTTGNSITVPTNAYYLRFSSSLPAENIYFVRSGKMPINVNHLIDDLIAFNDAIKEIYHTITDGSYFATDGKLYNSPNYSYTSRIKVAVGKKYIIDNARRCVKYDRFGNFIGYEDGLTEFTVPEGIAYIAFDINISNVQSFAIRYDSLSDSIYVRKDEIKDEIPIKISSPLLIADDNIECVEGTAGQVGAIYRIPIRSTGRYVLSFDFKLPRNIQQAGTSVKLAELNANDISGCEGGFLIKINPGAPSANAPYQQVLYNGGIAFYPSGRTNNNYKSEYRANCIDEKPFVSNDIFSIRYKGDLSQSANRDVKYEITNTGLRIYHSGNNSTIISESFPANKSYASFIASMRTKCALNGAYYNIIEFEDYTTSVISTDDIIRVSSIPMCGNYTEYNTPQWDAWPCYISAIDEEWHTIEIRFNKDGNSLGTTGNNIMVFILDGKDMRYIDNSFRLTGTGVFQNWLYLGCAGVEIKNFKYDGTTTKTGTPKIITYYGHDMIDSLIGESGTVNFSTGCLQTLIDLHRKYGWTFVGVTEIRDYLNGSSKRSIPEKIWTVMQDDQFFLAQNNDVAKKFDVLYRRNNCFAAFPMIDIYYTGQYSDIPNKCRLAQEMYCFLLHSELEYAKHSYQEVLTDIESQYTTYKSHIGDVNMFILAGGSHNMNTSHFIQAKGFAYCGTVDSGYSSKRYYNTTQPRITVRDDNISVSSIENRLKWFESI